VPLVALAGAIDTGPVVVTPGPTGARDAEPVAAGAVVVPLVAGAVDSAGAVVSKTTGATDVGASVTGTTEEPGLPTGAIDTGGPEIGPDVAGAIEAGPVVVGPEPGFGVGLMTEGEVMRLWTGGAVISSFLTHGKPFASYLQRYSAPSTLFSPTSESPAKIRVMMLAKFVMLTKSVRSRKLCVGAASFFSVFVLWSSP
jgi:hypothetical protein